MNEAYNSVSTQLQQLYTLLSNSLETLNKINLATTSQEDLIEIENRDLDGNVIKLQIPSFRYLKSELERIEANVNGLAGLNSNSQLLLADGSVRKVITSAIPKSPESIKEISSPRNFNIKNNWFFESFITPSVFIKLEIPGGIKSNIKKVKSQRFILDVNSQDKIDFFDENIKDRSDINRNTLIELLNNENISYFLDDNIVDLPIVENKFYGKFSVLRMESDLGNGIKRYKLDKVTYSDRTADFENTIGLKSNDELTLNESTRFRVVSIDSSLNTVDLKLIEGYGSIPIGLDILEIFKNPDIQKFIDIGFGYNERQIIFIKPIDESTNIESNFWSPGVALYTNELEFNFNGDIITFENYYKTQVTDFGSLLLGMSKDQPVPAVLAEKPNIPTINAENFKVVISNSHLKTTLIEEIENLNAQKENLNGEIKNLDLAISELRKTINNKSFSNDNEQISDQKRLTDLESERSNKNSEFTSIVEKILSNNRTLGTNSFKPRYRVRGFFDIPEPKQSKITKNQEIVAFEYEYRYLNTDGSSKANEQFTTNESKTGIFSNWTRVQTKPRQKQLNLETNSFEFVEENLDSSEDINTNQVDIPIQPNELVELRIRSISEAGYPQNPVTSDFSDIIRINFPSELVEQNITEEVVRQSEQDIARLKLESTLSNLGVNKHIADSFTINNKFFAHNAINLNSGFVTPEQAPITVFDKFVELEQRIKTLSDQVNRVKGSLRMVIIDEEGGETVISNNSTEKIFAGYYQNLVNDLTIKKGAIVTKTYFLVIENIGNNDLELLSFFPNVSRVDPATPELISGDNPDIPVSPNYTLNYNSVSYGDSPIFDVDSDPIGDGYSYQKRQEYGQYFFNRKFAIDGVTPLYSPGSIIDTSDSSPTSPILPAGTNWVYDLNGNIKVAEVDRFSDLGLDIHEEYFTATGELTGNPIGSKISDLIKSDNTLSEYDDVDNQPLSYRVDDQYLIGPKSCGSYLFFQVNNMDEIKIPGNEINSKIFVPSGRESSIKIPIRFQFRMTDFFGAGTTGTGNIDGDLTNSTKNVTYTKKIGVDLLTNNNQKFSFDLTFFAKYKPDGVTILETKKFSETLIRRNFFSRDIQNVQNG